MPSGNYLKIILHPHDTEAGIGEMAIFTVNASGGSELAWQWQKRQEDSWQDVNGETSRILSFAAFAENHGNIYRCRVTCGNAEAVSASAELRIVPRIVSQSGSISGYIGDTAELSVVATGLPTLRYQWQYYRKETAEWMNCSGTGSKSASFPVEIADEINGRLFRCRVTDGDGNMICSASMILHAEGRPAIQLRSSAETEPVLHESDEESVEIIEVVSLEQRLENNPVRIGRTGEHKTQRIVIDCSAWEEIILNPTFTVMCDRDDEIYQAAQVEQDGYIVTWTISSTDLACPGIGYAQVVAIRGEFVKKSARFATVVEDNLK